MGELSPQQLAQIVKQRGKELGFDLVGIAPAEPPFTYTHYLNWLAQGFHGAMAYMERRKKERQDVRQVFPEARSVIIGALRYLAPDPPSRELTGRVARYAWGLDYHEVVARKLEALLDFLRALLGEGVQGKVYVDTGPILERDFAVRAGLGWFGKNTCLIHPKLGSYLFLGELLVNVALSPDPPFLRSHCGNCTRCLVACPTGALVAPYQLDARRCISYLTIELRGSIPRKLRPLIGTWVFGCDICQEVCPWNRKVAPTQEEALKPRPWAAPDLLELVTLTEEEFRERFRQSPLRRAKRSGLVRNACVALGNLREPAAVPYLIRLLREDADPVVREHAAWALGRIATHEALKALRDALATETDDRVREEIRLSLQEATMPLPQPSPRDSDPCFLPERS